VLSSLDPYTTFVNLAGAQYFPTHYIRKIKEINFNLGYIQAHLTIDQALPGPQTPIAQHQKSWPAAFQLEFAGARRRTGMVRTPRARRA
jgi:hypothetical protein